MSAPQFKRTKTKPVQRARQSSPETNLSEDSTAQESPSTLATKLKNKAKRAQPKSRLSFGGEEQEGEGDVFQVKKSKLSRKIALGRSSLLPSNLDQASITPAPNGGPTYDKAYLSQLKANTPSSRPPLPENESYDADVSLNVGDDYIDSIQVTGIETSIPSESSIINAKQKRERSRATGVAVSDDYIALSVAERGDISQGPHPESRLVREDDELGDGDDEFAEYTSAQERIALGRKSKKVEAKKRRDALNEMIADAEEEDEETMEWEQEQLRRGGHTSDAASSTSAKEMYRPAPVPIPTPIPTLGPAITRLTQSLTDLTKSHASNTSSMTALAEEREQVDSREVELRKMIDRAESKRSWFVAFRDWVESVANFLDEKYPVLENLEDDHVSILKERADMINQRRVADDEDDLSLFLGILPGQTKTGMEELDELGRVQAAANPAAARRDRRISRIARRTRRHAMNTGVQQIDLEEGYSSDNSLQPPDAIDYDRAMRKLRVSGQSILSDVRAQDFRDPSQGIEKWFGEWRERYDDSYIGAWGGLGLVGAWEFWLRLEILSWNPIEDSKTLDSFNWFSSLHKYSRPDSDVNDLALGPDGDLVSAMVSTAMIPRMCKTLEAGAFDPYSSRNLQKLLDLTEQIEASTDPDHSKFQMLLKSVAEMFQTAVASTEGQITQYLSLSNPRFDPEAIPARQRFLARRMKLLQNLLRWRKYTGEKFGLGQLATKLVSHSIFPVAETGWEVGGKEKVAKVANLLPPELVPYSMKSRLGVP